MVARAGACRLARFLCTSGLCPIRQSACLFSEHERQLTLIPAAPYDAGHHLPHRMQALFEPEPAHPPSIPHDDTSLDIHMPNSPRLHSYYFCSPCQYHNVTPAQTSFDLSFDPFHMAPLFPVPVSTLPLLLYDPFHNKKRSKSSACYMSSPCHVLIRNNASYCSPAFLFQQHSTTIY